MDTIQMKDILPAWTPGTAIGHRNLILVPLQGEEHRARFQNYLLASEAIDAGVLTVTEVNESGTVPELLAVNKAARPVLLIDGEELQGAKQNRILNTSVLLRPHSKTRIPVSCVEEGRWSHISPTFKAGNYAPSSLRQRKSRDVQYSLRTRGRAESDQGAVWDSVAKHIEARAAQSPTRAMSDAMATLGDVLGRYHEALPYPAAACGVVAAVCGRFVAMDAFDSTSTLEAIWGRLLASYVMDTEMDSATTQKSFTARTASVLLAQVGDHAFKEFRSIGVGEDIRFDAGNLLGQGLCVKEEILHLSVFPATGSTAIRHGAQSQILSPSRRNHTRSPGRHSPNFD